MKHPTFLIVGAAKCGTTSVFRYLEQHPNIYTPSDKELHYFDARHRKVPISWYLERFKDASSEHLASGEATPSYCFLPGVIERIHEFNKDLKLIMMLRDPIARAISHYWMEVKRYRERRELLHALREETKRIISSKQRFVLYSYQLRGIYHRQLDQIYKYFPKEQVKIVKLEDLESEPQGTMNDITGFLGVPSYPFEFTKHFVGDYPETELEAIEVLKNYFELHNKLLKEKYGIEY